MDADAVKKAVELSGGKLLTVEDHYAYVSFILINYYLINFSIGRPPLSRCRGGVLAWPGRQGHPARRARRRPLWQGGRADGLGRH